MGYLIGQLGGLLPIPGGVGGIDGGLIGTLIVYGAPAAATAAAVLAYRVILFWLPLLIGGVAFAPLRRGLDEPARPDLCDPLEAPAVVDSARERVADPHRRGRGRYLGIYLTEQQPSRLEPVGIELARRGAKAYAATELGAFFAGLAAEIEADRETLKALMAANGIVPQRYKRAAAWAGEKVARLKFNGALIRRSPLTPFVELETLAIGIHGKRLLWQALRATAGRRRRLRRGSTS